MNLELSDINMRTYVLKLRSEIKMTILKRDGENVDASA